MIHGVTSRTSALEDVGDALEDRFAEELGELEPLADQIGVAYASGGRVLGLDLFDRPATLAKYLKGIVAGVALDAHAGSTVKGTKESVERFLVGIDRTDRDVVTRGWPRRGTPPLRRCSRDRTLVRRHPRALGCVCGANPCWREY